MTISKNTSLPGSTRQISAQHSQVEDGKREPARCFASTDKMSSPGYAPPLMLLDSSRAMPPVARWSYRLTCYLATAVACQETSRLFHTPRLVVAWRIVTSYLPPPTTSHLLPPTACNILRYAWCVRPDLAKAVSCAEPIAADSGAMSTKASWFTRPTRGLVVLHHLPSHTYEGAMSPTCWQSVAMPCPPLIKLITVSNAHIVL